MAPKPDAGPAVRRAGDDASDRLKMLQELAKLTKPTGASAKGKSEETDEE